MGRPGVAHVDRITIDKSYIKSRVQVNTNMCWIWQRAINPSGYGEAYNGIGRIRAHRLSYIVFGGELPEGYTVDHKCHNWDKSCKGGSSCPHRACVNPGHLEAVTCRENNLRSPNTLISINILKTHCLRGHKFTEENTYRRPDRPNDRSCKACLQLRASKYLSRKRG